jgi:hypothetical protein
LVSGLNGEGVNVTAVLCKSSEARLVVERKMIPGKPTLSSWPPPRSAEGGLLLTTPHPRPTTLHSGGGEWEPLAIVPGWQEAQGGSPQ